jgi:ABC-2 type transport system permease protein
VLAETPAGVIYDRGYRNYEGPRLGRPQIVRALCWHSFRSAFGLGRGPKAKIVPVIVFVVLCLPAVINAVIVARGGSTAVDYGTYVLALRIVMLTIFVAVQAPELVSRDIRSRVLPLYFSRPIHRGDYPLAKLVAFILACVALLDVPLLLLYLGNIVSAKGGSDVWLQTRELAGGLAVGLLWAVLVAAISLALASLSGRRAYATGVVAIFFFLTFTLAELVYSIGQHGAVGGAGGGPVPGPRLAGLISPYFVIDGIRQWLGGHARGAIAGPGSYGPVYGAMFLLLLAASVATLAARYRKAALA